MMPAKRSRSSWRLLLGFIVFNLGMAEVLAASAGGLAAVREELGLLQAGEALSEERLLVLSAQCLKVADEATENGPFLRAMTLLADVCQAAPIDAARQVRADALRRLLVRSFDSVRWSALVSQRFQPALERLPQDLWREELALYDGLLDRLRGEFAAPQPAAELLYAKASIRGKVNRRWPFLSGSERTQALALLTELEQKHGALKVPGGKSGGPGTYGARGRALRYELENLYFGAVAPATVGVDLSGQPLDIATHNGSVVILDFWSTFCLPCLAMVPDTKALLEEFSGEPVVLLGVNGDQEQEKGRRTAERVEMTWQSFWDGPQGTSGPIASAWRVGDWPTVVVLDQKGRIRYRFVGQEEVEQGLRGALQVLLAEDTKSNA